MSACQTTIEGHSRTGRMGITTIEGTREVTEVETTVHPGRMTDIITTAVVGIRDHAKTTFSLASLGRRDPLLRAIISLRMTTRVSLIRMRTPISSSSPITSRSNRRISNHISSSSNRSHRRLQGRAHFLATWTCRILIPSRFRVFSISSKTHKIRQSSNKSSQFKSYSTTCSRPIREMRG